MKVGIITSNYGNRINPISNKEEFHNGIDIGVDTGTYLYAIYNGTITDVRYSKSYGNIVDYETDNDYRVFYAHMEETFVEIGDKVIKGDIVGTVGSTGFSTGPHLHYSLWKKGELVNPIDFITLANPY